MNKSKLSRRERVIEQALVRGEFHPVNPVEFQKIAEAITERKKDAVLNIRLNSGDLARIKRKAKNLRVPYQTFISEILHRFAA